MVAVINDYKQSIKYWSALCPPPPALCLSPAQVLEVIGRPPLFGQGGNRYRHLLGTGSPCDATVRTGSKTFRCMSLHPTNF